MIEVYFDNIHDVIIHNINSSKNAINICVAWFTDQDIYNSLVQAQRRGVMTNVIIANHEFNINSKIDFKEIINKNGTVSYIGNINDGKTDSLMHNKFCIIDSKKVITGSYNWTYKARKNQENIIVISQSDIVVKFETKFESIKPKYGFAVKDNEVHLMPIEQIMSKWDKPPKSEVKNGSIINDNKTKIKEIFSKF